MKKKIAFLLSLVCLLSCFYGCKCVSGDSRPRVINDNSSALEDKIKKVGDFKLYVPDDLKYELRSITGRRDDSCVLFTRNGEYQWGDEFLMIQIVNEIGHEQFLPYSSSPAVVPFTTGDIAWEGTEQYIYTKIGEKWVAATNKGYSWQLSEVKDILSSIKISFGSEESEE